MPATSAQPRIQINRSILGINASLINVESSSRVKWSLHKNGATLETSTGTENLKWQSTHALTEGTYEVKAEVVDDFEEALTLTSQPLKFGCNLQSRGPQKARVARPNEYPPSFKELVFLEARKSFREPRYSAWLLDVKTNAYQFADALGYKTPILENNPVPAAELALEPETVVKPLTGVMSRGVILIGHDKIIDLANNKLLSGTAQIKSTMSKLLEEGLIKKDEWIREKLMYSDIDASQPARDLKFYTFYGKVKLVLETIRVNGVTRCWYDQSLNRINTGKYPKNLFAGNGIPLDYFRAAQEIGLSIPAPFVRIDFLASSQGIVLNEITPKPGGSNQFSPNIDQTLGESLIAADSRLKRDLLQGKTFDAFNRIRLQK